jgi:hypothetical protein
MAESSPAPARAPRARRGAASQPAPAQERPERPPPRAQRAPSACAAAGKRPRAADEAGADDGAGPSHSFEPVAAPAAVPAAGRNAPPRKPSAKAPRRGAADRGSPPPVGGPAPAPAPPPPPGGFLGFVHAIARRLRR